MLWRQDANTHQQVHSIAVAASGVVALVREILVEVPDKWDLDIIWDGHVIFDGIHRFQHQVCDAYWVP